MGKSGTCWVAYTTVDSKAKAKDLAARLVAGKNLACVNIVGPVESVYEWKGLIEHAEEWMLMMKCSDEQREGLKAAVVAMHGYELPELIMIEVTDGHGPYLDWVSGVSGQVRGSGA